jgi:hypothetical protein
MDRHHLPVSARRQRQFGCEVLPARRNLDTIARPATLERPGRVPRRFGPFAGNRTAAIGCIAGEIEIVAVAGAAQVETKLVAAAPDVVARPAAQPLLLEHAVARPRTSHGTER